MITHFILMLTMTVFGHHGPHGPELFCRVGYHRAILHGVITCVHNH